MDGEYCHLCGGDREVIVPNRYIGQEPLTKQCPRCAGKGWEPGRGPTGEGTGCAKALWLIFAAPVGLFLIIWILNSSRDTGPDLKRADARPTKTLEGYEIGSCVNVYPEDPRPAPCDQPHDAEVAGLIRVDIAKGEVRPALNDLRAFGVEECTPLVVAYLLGDPEAAGLRYDAVSPKRASWDIGNRDIACVVVPGGDATFPPGSAQGSAKGAGD